MQQRAKFFYRQFIKQPLWFKLVVPLCFISSVLFSSSLFTQPIYGSLSKLAAAIFFCVFGYKLRSNKKLSILFYVFALICLILAWTSWE